MPHHESQSDSIMPAHPVAKAGVYLILLAVAIALTALFWQGTHDSPYPPTEQRENQ